MRFLHAADLHLDSPLRGLDRHDGAPVEPLRSATRRALVALVDLAIRREVQLLLIAGDLYDGDWEDFRTGLFFHQQMMRLAPQGIRVFIVRGNHDAESRITRQLPAMPHVHVFDSRRAGSVDLPEWGVAVHGRSFSKPAVTEDLLPGYPAPVSGRFNIGLLHTGLTGNPDHDPYAPTTPARLIATGYDYWALGHIHQHQIVQESGPRIVFPGNLQGRHARETGPKGCELVEVDHGRIVHREFVELDVLRWHRVELDLSGVDTIDLLGERLAAAFEALLQPGGAAGPAGEHARERLHCARVVLFGRSVLHGAEAAQPGLLEAAVRAQALQQAGRLWIEQVRVELASPLDRGALAARDDALGEVLREVDRLLADPQALRDWAGDALGAGANLPHELADLRPDRLDEASWRALLLDAEAMVLAQLGRDLTT